MPDISVIIPTYDDREALVHALQSLFRQTFPADRYEIVVLDDGSTDGTREAVEQLKPNVCLRYHWQPNQGRSAARNAGARLALGTVLLFLDSDILAEPELLERHHRYYAQHPKQIGVQGRTVMHPDCRVTLFMQTKDLTPDLTPRSRDNLSPYQVTTRNLSMRMEDFWAAGGFDEQFTVYGWEDMDLGLRLHANGVRFHYDPQMLAYHYAVETLERKRAKARQAGEGAVYFWRKHGARVGLGILMEVHPLLLPLKWLVFRTRLYGRLVRKVLPWAERGRRVWIASECYNYLIWESYYDGVFPVLKNGVHAVKTEPRTVSAHGNGQHPPLPVAHAPSSGSLPETANVAEP